MKKNKRLTALLHMDFVRAVCSWRFFALTIGLWLICLASAADIIQLAIEYPENRSMFCSTAEIMKMLGFDRFKTVMVVILAGIYSTSYSDDWNCRYFRCILYRTDLHSYALSKILITIGSVVLSTILGFLLFIISMFPLMELYPSEQSVSWYGAYQQLAMQQPIFFVIIVGWNFGLSAALLAVVGLWISVKQPSGMAAIGGAFLTFYFLYAMSLIVPYFLAFEMISARPSVLFFDQPILSFLYNTGFLLLLILFASIGFYRSLKRRWRDGFL